MVSVDRYRTLPSSEVGWSKLKLTEIEIDTCGHVAAARHEEKGDVEEPARLAVGDGTVLVGVPT